MTEEEKKTLVDAVNCKYPHQNLTEIYYNIGRALPFTAQRFPDGRVSDWYRNLLKFLVLMTRLALVNIRI